MFLLFCVLRTSKTGFTNVFSSQQFHRCLSRTTTSSSSSPLQAYPTFNHMVDRYKQAAACSFVLEDRSKNAFVWHHPNSEILSRLLGGQTSQIYRWRVGSRDGKQKRFLLVQFGSLSSLRLAIRALDQTYKVPMYDRIGFLKDSHIAEWRASTEYHQPRIEVQNEMQPALETLYQIVFDNSPTTAPISFEDFNPLAGTTSGTGPRTTSPLISPSSSPSLDTKMSSISKLMAGEELLSELQYKLRFFILHQMEMVIRRCTVDVSTSTPPTRPYGSRKKQQSSFSEQQHLMNQYEIVPFGSEVSCFGSAHSDLDLCFIYRGQLPGDRNVAFHRGIRLLHSVSIMLERSRKLQSAAAAERHQQLFVHNHFSTVERIFRAFVPIIKCRSHLLPEMNIDISVDTEKNSGVQMASYLFHCARADARVRPFVLLLKSWARHHRIVRQTPGDWFSSFQLTMLGVAFLQSRHIVPTIEQWQRSSSGGTLLQNQTDSTSTQQIADLLRQFFIFMVNFDFWRHAFDLNSGLFEVPKPHADRDACYIANPFLRQLNITKTVSETELERFLSKCQQSLEIISSKPTGGGSEFPLEELFVELNDRLQSLGY